MNGILVHLNADVGEGFGIWCLGDDEALLSVITSANALYGFQAFDPAVHAEGLRLRGGSRHSERCSCPRPGSGWLRPASDRRRPGGGDRRGRLPDCRHGRFCQDRR